MSDIKQDKRNSTNSLVYRKKKSIILDNFMSEKSDLQNSKNMTPIKNLYSQMSLNSPSSAFVRQQLSNYQTKKSRKLTASFETTSKPVSCKYSNQVSQLPLSGFCSPINNNEFSVDPQNISFTSQINNENQQSYSNSPIILQPVSPVLSNRFLLQHELSSQKSTPAKQYTGILKKQVIAPNILENYQQLKEQQEHLKFQRLQKIVDQIQQHRQLLQKTDASTVEKGNDTYSQSAVLNKRIQQIRSSAGRSQGIKEQSAYDNMKQTRLHNGKQYRTLVGSMNKQLKSTSKELEELRNKLGDKNIQNIQKILAKLSIINHDRNYTLKENSNNQIVFDKMMEHICEQRKKLTLHEQAKLKIKEDLQKQDSKITYLDMPKYDTTWKDDFFEITENSLKNYKKTPLHNINEILALYIDGQDEFLNMLRSTNPLNNYDISKYTEAHFDPFFNDPLLKEIMCKHLIFKKVNQKIDFLGSKQRKKRNINDILNRINNPSQCSSDFDSEQSFFYLPKDQQFQYNS